MLSLELTDFFSFQKDIYNSSSLIIFMFDQAPVTKLLLSHNQL